jgi:alpha-L-fucosidase
MNNSWGFNITDKGWKSTKDLIGFLVRAAGANANLLLNIGPRPDGTIQPEAAQRLRDVGVWLVSHGTAIYNTRGGPISPRPWGVTTQRGDTVFVHLLRWQDQSITIPAIAATVTHAATLGVGGSVTFTQTAAGVTLTLPEAPAADEPDHIIVLTTTKSPPRR